jgi:hypothetical protein
MIGGIVAAMTVRRDSLDFKRLVVPRVDDPWWVEATAPLLAFFKKDRTIDAVVEWGRRQYISGCLIRHMLAWLSFNHVVRYDDEDKVWKVVVRSSVERKVS